jgi:hypothetical protein
MAMPPTAFVLQQSLTARLAARWDVQARYALHRPGEKLTLPAGTWLLALPDPDDDRPHPPHYRLADGRVVTLDAPLTEAQAGPLTDPQALAALTAYRPLAQALNEDWGLWLERVDHNPPFRLIQCPLCAGTAFTTVAFAEVWCDGCQAQFSVRHTAGDPGFVVDCTWPYYDPRAADYILPRGGDLLLTMVFKNSGDPLDLSHGRHCHRADCTADQVALTDGREGPLRAGCTPAPWATSTTGRSTVTCPPCTTMNSATITNCSGPAPPRSRLQGSARETWPLPAVVPVTGLSWEEQRQLAAAAELLAGHAPGGRGRDDLISTLKTLADRPSRAPYAIGHSPWPQRKELAEGEKYLLHRWLLEKGRPDELVTAIPVWLVVTAATEDKHARRWRVVRDNICIRCGRPVTAGDMAPGAGQAPARTVTHSYCRESWQTHGWRPVLFTNSRQADSRPEGTGTIS